MKPTLAAGMPAKDVTFAQEMGSFRAPLPDSPWWPSMLGRTGPVKGVEEAPDRAAQVPVHGEAFQLGAGFPSDGVQPGAGLLQGGQLEVPDKADDGGRRLEVVRGGFQLRADR